MKRIAKILISTLLCLVIICTAVVPSFAASSVGQVSGAKATNVTYNSATLSWNAVSGISGYEVEQSTGSSWTVIYSKVTKTSLALTKLSTGTTYKYRIRAYKTGLFNRKTYGNYSSVVTVKPTLAKPTNVKAVSLSTTSSKITWSKVTGATGYYVQQYVSKKWKTVKTLNAKTLSYTATKLKLGSSYKYQIIAYIKVGNATVKSAAAAVTVKASVPTPSAFKAASVTTTGAKLTWGKVADATGYVIEQYIGGKWKKVYTIKKNSTVSQQIKIVPATNYQYRIKAYKTVGKKTYNSAVSSTLNVKYNVPAATNLKSVTTATAAKLTWTAAKGVTGYQVYQNGKLVANVKTASYTAAIVPGTAYKFKVVSYLTLNKKNYNGAASNELTVKYTVPAASALKAATTADKAVLSWNASANAAGYQVQQQDGSAWTTIANVKTTTYTAAIKPNTNYNYRVVSYITVGGKTYSAAASNVINVNYTVAAPTNLTANATSNTSIELNWKGTANADGYIVYKLNGSQWEEIKDVKTTSVVIDSLEAKTDYSFKVVAYETEDKYISATAAMGTFGAVGVPGKTTVTNYAETAVTISWEAADDADGYTVYRSTDMNTWTECKTVTATTVTVTGLDASKTYGIAVAAYHISGGSKTYSVKNEAVKVSINADKVALVKQVADSINKVKADTGRFKVTADEIFKSEIRNGKVKSDLLLLVPHRIPTFPFVEYTDTWDITDIMEEYELSKELEEDLNSDNTYVCSFSGGYGIYKMKDIRYVRDADGNYIKDADGNYVTEEYERNVPTSPMRFIAPSAKNASVYNETNLTAAGKAYKNVSVSEENGKTAITITLFSEKASSSDKGVRAPYHSNITTAITDQLDDFSSLEDGASASATATVGNSVTIDGVNYNGTTVKAIIDKDGNLEYYDSLSPFTLSTHAVLTIIKNNDFEFDIVFDGIFKYTYNIER